LADNSILTATSKRNKTHEVLLNFEVVELLAHHDQLAFSKADLRN
jgi:hypothetical protein